MRYDDDRDNLLDGPPINDRGEKYTGQFREEREHAEMRADDLAVATGRQCGKCNKPMNPVDAMVGQQLGGGQLPVCGPCASAGAQHAMSAAARAQKTWGI